MSFICRVLIGWFDAPNPRCRERILPSKPLGANQVHGLQAACDELFDIKVRLINSLTKEFQRSTLERVKLFATTWRYLA